MNYSKEDRLSTTDVKHLLQSFGYNELNTSSPRIFFQLAFEAVKEPQFLLLLGCGSLYFFVSRMGVKYHFTYAD
jgi:hypothetical protein